MTAPCPCLSDLYCCSCRMVCVRERDGHITHEKCQTTRPGPNVSDIPQDVQNQLNRQAQDDDIPF